MITPDLTDEELFQALSRVATIASDKETGFLTGDPILVSRTAINEITNGGFYQFYENQGFNTERFIEDLRMIGASTLADIVEDSLNVFNRRSDVLRPRDELQILMWAKDFDYKTWHASDQKFYEEMDNFDAYAARYMRAQWEQYGPLLNSRKAQI